MNGPKRPLVTVDLPRHWKPVPSAMPGAAVFTSEGGITAVITLEKVEQSVHRVVRIIARGRAVTEDDIADVRGTFFAPSAEVDVGWEEAVPEVGRLSSAEVTFPGRSGQ